MSLVAICWSHIRKVTIWKDLDLDFILNQGDRVYKACNIDRTLYVDEIPSELNFENVIVRVEFINTVDCFNDKDKASIAIEKDIFYDENTNGVILFINGYCTAILEDKNKNIYIFDSHSRNDEGIPIPDGKSILLMFTSIENASEYIFRTSHTAM